jgi:hypothetical protein
VSRGGVGDKLFRLMTELNRECYESVSQQSRQWHGVRQRGKCAREALFLRTPPGEYRHASNRGSEAEAIRVTSTYVGSFRVMVNCRIAVVAVAL